MSFDFGLVNKKLFFGTTMEIEEPGNRFNPFIDNEEMLAYRIVDQYLITQQNRKNYTFEGPGIYGIGRNFSWLSHFYLDKNYGISESVVQELFSIGSDTVKEIFKNYIPGALQGESEETLASRIVNQINTQRQSPEYYRRCNFSRLNGNFTATAHLFLDNQIFISQNDLNIMREKANSAWAKNILQSANSNPMSDMNIESQSKKRKEYYS